MITPKRQWNVSLIRNLFFAPDANPILTIPLCLSAGEDVMAWEREKSCIYSVRSAYRSIVLKNQGEELVQSDVAPSSSDGKDKWKTLWKLSVVPKVRFFLWRVLQGILPDYGTLTWWISWLTTPVEFLKQNLKL
jgi:hypothetical protein